MLRRAIETFAPLTVAIVLKALAGSVYDLSLCLFMTPQTITWDCSRMVAGRYNVRIGSAIMKEGNLLPDLKYPLELWWERAYSKSIDKRSVNICLPVWATNFEL